MRLAATELTTSHLIEHYDVLCRILSVKRFGDRAVLVRVLPDSAFADPILLHFWLEEQVEVCGWSA